MKTMLIYKFYGYRGHKVWFSDVMVSHVLYDMIKIIVPKGIQPVQFSDGRQGFEMKNGELIRGVTSIVHGANIIPGIKTNMGKIIPLKEVR